MAVLVVWASPNKNGLTASCKDMVIQGISSAGKEYVKVHLNLQDVQRCRVCDNGKGLCAKGKCVIEDDFTQLYEQVVAAEAVVWITPVYWHDMAEPLKAFFDRLRRCETSHNHFLQNKKCILVAAAGGSGNGAIRCLHLMEDTLGHMKMEIRDRLPVTKFSRDYMLQALKASANSLCKEI